MGVRREHRVRRVIVAVLGAVCASLALPTANVVQAATGPGYVTVLFGRNQNGIVGANCQPLPGSVSIPTMLAAFKQHRWTATGAVVVPWTQETTDHCFQATSIPSWATMRSWRDQYGFQAISQGDYVDVKTQTPQQVNAQTCGLLPKFSSEGFARAWGLFAYPGNFSTPTDQAQIIDKCFAYGRKYGGQVSRLPVPAPYFASDQQLRGGNCNLPNLPCSHIYNWGLPYEAPSQIAAEVQVHGGQWRMIQVYRLVMGSGPDWNCTSPDWHGHWTDKHEVYCWNDLLAALSSMPRGTIVTDPGSVAQAFHQLPPH
jgi:hypothetical protein